MLPRGDDGGVGLGVQLPPSTNGSIVSGLGHPCMHPWSPYRGACALIRLAGLLVCDVHGRGDRCSSGDVGSALPTTDDVSGWPELCGRLGIGCLHHCAG